MKKWLAVFDNHGDMQDDDAVETMFAFKKYWKPEIVIHGGDNWDFRYLRRAASEEERREDTVADFNIGLDFIARLAPTHFLRGNHDERLWDQMRSDNGQTRAFAAATIQDILRVLGKCKMYPYDKRKGVCEIGHLRIIHGYSSGISAVRTAALVYGACLMGHVHYIDQVSIARLSTEVAYSCGALCQLGQDYNRGQIQTLRQAHGWAYGVLCDDGTYFMHQARQINGKWMLPTEMRAF
jgi:hypothetical protein